MKMNKKILERFKAKIKSARDQRERIDAMNELAYTLRALDSKRAIKLSRKVYKLAKSISYEKGIAYSLLGVGFAELFLSHYELSLQTSLDALEIFKKIRDVRGEAIAFTYQSMVYRSLGNLDQAVQSSLNGLNSLSQWDGEKSYEYNEAKGWCIYGLGGIYVELRDFEYALKYYQEALDLFQEIGLVAGKARTFNGLGNIYQALEKYEQALEYYFKSLKMDQKSGFYIGESRALIDIGTCFEHFGDYEQALDYNFQSLEIREKIKYRNGAITNLINVGQIYIKQDKLDQAETFLQRALVEAKEMKVKSKIYRAAQLLSELYEQKSDYQKSLEYYRNYHQVEKAMFSEESSSKLKNLQVSHQIETSQKEAEIYRLKNVELSKANNEIKQQKQLLEQQAEKLELAYTQLQVRNIELAAMHREVEEERQKSEKLLLNILPVKITNDLKKFGKTEPETFENVSVLFSDFVGFTKISSIIEPKVVINELNDLFTNFDNIIEKNQCERIKTIGDAYLAVCGMPESNKNHVQNIANAAIGIIKYLEKRNKSSDNSTQWQIRIGIHSGRVVGGIVGVKKYIYDVFGDTINTAARMEANSEPMKINASETTYQLILASKDDHLFCFVKRESLLVKGKGKMKMYFLSENSPKVGSKDSSGILAGK